MDPFYLIDRLKELSTAEVSDALDALGLHGAAPSLKPQWDCSQVAARICTVQLGPKSAADRARPLAAHVFQGVKPPREPDEDMDRILVVAGGTEAEIRDLACWGHLLSKAAAERGLVGVVVDGLVRCSEDSEFAGYPIFARGATMLGPRNRIRHVSSGQPVTVAGVRVQDGDFLVTDRDGVVFVPAAQANRVVAMASKLSIRRARMAEALSPTAPPNPKAILDTV